MTYAPIVLFVYNRPDHTRRTVEGLLGNAEAKESLLYIFADGPKEGASDTDKAKISAVRDYIHSISGFKDIIIKEHQKNLSLAVSTINGMTEVFSRHEKVIMMEDDDVPTPYFLDYVNRCLDRYASDSRIWCVSGYTDTTLLPPRGSDDVFLVRRPSSWGFGTWKRCWDKVIWDKDILRGLLRHKSFIYGYNRWCGMDSASGLANCINGKTSSWSIRYNLGSYLTRSYTILPTKSLILNIGLDGSGTHSRAMSQHLETMDHRVTLPEEIQFDPVRNHQLMMTFVPRGLRSRMKYHLGLLTATDILKGRFK